MDADPRDSDWKYIGNYNLPFARSRFKRHLSKLETKRQLALRIYGGSVVLIDDMFHAEFMLQILKPGDSGDTR